MQPKRRTTKTPKDLVVIPEPDMDDAEDVATLSLAGRKDAIETMESPDKCTEMKDAPNRQEAPKQKGTQKSG